ncbi:GNAT family N-acetyltransferase [bacterium]|nr:GNAT family N-acetyltransferase [bacterium]
MRPGLPSDLWALHWLRSLAGWNQTVGQWIAFLSSPSAVVFVACSGTSVIGVSTIWNYQGRLAWIGMVIVHPAYRRRGIARCLLNRCLEFTSQRGVDFVGLDATPAGRPLYHSLGFVEGEPLDRWVLEASKLRVRPRASLEVCVIEEGRESIAMLLKGEFDRLSFGVDRTDLLMSLLSECRSSVVLREGSGEELGYGVLRHGARHSYLGPVVAESKVSGRVIVTQLLGREHNGSVIWDLPIKNDAAVELAVELGFCRQRPLFRMWRPVPIMADRSDRIWAIVDPALG